MLGNREIKFRAWNKVHKRMFTAYCINWDTGLVYCEGEDGNTHTFGMIDIELMQYTGLKDKNGKEIYEGDLWIARPLGMPYEIKWHETGWYLFRHNSKLYDNADGLANGEVIGNIYEHPHLLKEAESIENA